MSIQFDLSKEQNSIIKVIGVGGGGSNAVNHMFLEGIVGVEFVVCNTDQQALDLSPVHTKIPLGKSFTEGRGAGMDPEVGKRAALEAEEQVKDILSRGTKMVFITAGMGKGTGTGGAPVIARVAREMGILTVGLVTTPFFAEGPKRLKQAQEGISELRNFVDTILVISNDKLREIHGNLPLSRAFGNADSILTNAAKSIAEIITVAGHVNVDFNDVNTVMRNSGVAIMGTAIADGENRAMKAVELALNSPLLNDNDIKGAKNILLNITSGSQEVTLDEVTDIQEYVQQMAGLDTNIIWGVCTNSILEQALSVTIIATGFHATDNMKTQLKKIPLAMEKPAEPVAPVATIVSAPVVAPEMELKTVAESIVEKKEEPLRENIIDLTRPVEKEKVIETLTLEIETTVSSPVELNLSPEKKIQEPSIKASEEIVLKEVPTINNQIPVNEDPQNNRNLHQKKVDRLKSLNYGQFKATAESNMYDRESTPAYLRKNVPLKDQPHSSESNQSPYYLEMPDENNPNQVEFKKNQFLHGHDRVD